MAKTQVAISLPIEFSEVCEVVYQDLLGTNGRSLTGCFSQAITQGGTFDATYSGSKDRLSNFRGYQIVVDNSPPTTPTNPLISTSNGGASYEFSYGASTDTGGSGLQGYQIYKDGSTWGGIRTTLQESISEGDGFECTSVWSVKAVDNAGNYSGLATASAPAECGLWDEIYFSTTPFSNGSQSCTSGNLINSMYTDGGTYSLEVGDKISTTPNGLSLFDGSDLFWKAQQPNGVIYSLKINSVGEITIITIC